MSTTFSKVSTCPEHDDHWWDTLLDYVVSGEVIPIVGPGVTTKGPDNVLLSSWLVEKLADSLKIVRGDGPPIVTLNDVVCRFLSQGGDWEIVHKRLSRILSRDCPTPGETLRQLVSIEDFQFFITTTCDPLLEDEVNNARYGGDEQAKVYAYSPNAELKDLPARKDSLDGTTIYHILGKHSPACDYVVWEDDMMEFMLGLCKEIEQLKNLAMDLKDPKYHFLLLGLNLSDWLVRFFLRTARQKSRAEGFSRIEYIAEDPSNAFTDSLVMYFGSVDKKVRVISGLPPCTCGDPRGFIEELAKRWKARRSDDGVNKRVVRQRVLRESGDLARGRVFISYAREDAIAARNLKNDLESHGVDVLFDEDRLHTGHNFDFVLEDDVLRRCDIFISVISRVTEGRRESYFNQERNWAAKRALRWSDYDRGNFYHPVIVDDLPLGEVKREPRIFHSSQRVHLENGRVNERFLTNLKLIIADLIREGEE